jgi:hypothetical protein
LAGNSDGALGQQRRQLKERLDSLDAKRRLKWNHSLSIDRCGTDNRRLQQAEMMTVATDGVMVTAVSSSRIWTIFEIVKWIDI